MNAEQRKRGECGSSLIKRIHLNLYPMRESCGRKRWKRKWRREDEMEEEDVLLELRRRMLMMMKRRKRRMLSKH